MDEDSVPVCAITETRTGPQYQTLCVTPSYLEELAEEEDSSSSKGKMMMMMGMKKKSSSMAGGAFETYTCGCCDPLLEGDSYPSFCNGRICAADPTPCGRFYEGRKLLQDADITQQHDNRLLMNKKKKKKKKIAAATATAATAATTTTTTTTAKPGNMGMMMKTKNTERTRIPLRGVTICVDGQTLCVDDLEPMFLGMNAPEYSCGPC